MLVRGSELKRKVGAMRFYIAIFVIVALAIYGGMFWGNHQLQQQQVQIEALQKSISQITVENNNLTKGLNILGVELEVERLANKEMQASLREAMEQQSVIRKDLSFYQKIMAPELTPQGLAIDSFEVESTSVESEFRYALVLMQQNKRKRHLSGQVSIYLSGSENGEAKKLLLTDLTSEKDKLGFRFKYFEVLEGRVRLPKDFVPEQIQIVCQIDKPKKAKLEQSFDWVVGNLSS